MLLKYYIFMLNFGTPTESKMIIFSNNHELIDEIHTLSIKLSRGVPKYDLVSISKYSPQRGLIKYHSLKSANAIIANIYNFTNYIEKAKQFGNYQYLQEIIGAWKFDLIILDNAYELILYHNEAIENLLKSWEPVECHALVICKSNDKNNKTKQKLAKLQSLIEEQWMQFFLPHPAYEIQHIS